MPRANRIIKLVESISEAALDPAAWPGALNALADATGAHVAALGSHDVRTNAWSNIAPRQDPEYIQLYYDYWAPRNPLRQMWQPDPRHGVVTPEMLMPREEYTRTPFFQEWVVPQHIEAAIATKTLLDDGVVTVLRLWRPWRVGDFRPQEIELFAALIPHIRRAVQIQHRMAVLEMQRATSVAAFDRLLDGVLLIDSSFGILFANRAADALLCEGDGLRRKGDGIAAATPACTVALRQLIGGGNGGARLSHAGGRCELTRQGGRAPLAVLVVPLHSEVSWITLRRPAAVLFVTDPDRDRRLQADALLRRFGLTGAESRFVGEIVKGDGLQAAADRLHVSLATARTHLRHVFEKTGIQRQAELVALMAACKGALRDD
jgi:DNA-binding CsgD family transcriptional regulator/PAS domain-containing protein